MRDEPPPADAEGESEPIEDRSAIVVGILIVILAALLAFFAVRALHR